MHRSRAAIIGSVAVALIVVGLVGLLVVVRSPGEGVANASPSATSPPVASGMPTESPPPSVTGEWGAVILPPYEPLADLAADDADGAGIDPTGSFTFTSLTSMPAVELATGLIAQPAVDLDVEPGPTADVAVVRPASPMVANTRYQVRLHGPDGAVAGEWSFLTGGPLHVVRQLPTDRSTQVPADTAVEIEFDNDGVTGVEGHFSIEPVIDGAFEVHGRTWAFVPASPLEPATLYTVTLTAGVGIIDSDHVLESDVRFAFETAGPEAELTEAQIIFESPIHEVRPDDAAIIPVTVHVGSSAASRIERRVSVYGLPTLEAAVEAARTLSTNRSWAVWSTNGSVSTDGLGEFAAFDAVATLEWPGQQLQLPSGLPEGWYLLDIEQVGRDAQIVLQVTDVAAYILVSETRTVGWVNDVGTASPLAGAQLTAPDGAQLAETDATGLFDIVTPAALVDGAGDELSSGVLLVSLPDGRITMVRPDPESQWFFGPAASSSWWLLFGTDRLHYREEDTINSWGFITSREDREVPDQLELRLTAGWDANGPPIERAAITPSARGALIGELPVRQLPAGQYTVGLFVAGESVATTSITVTDIRKPVFGIELSTDRRAYVTGEPVRVRAAADFYDGSSAPGLRLRVSTSGVTGAAEEVVTLGESGTAELTYEAATAASAMDFGSVMATTAAPEEGSSFNQSSFVVFPSTAWIDAEATFADGAVTVAGRLTRVDLERAESQLLDRGWVEDPSGQPLSGHQVSVAVDRVSWEPVQIGTTYDFIQKETVPQYRYDRKVESIGTFTPVSANDGSFVLDLPFDDATGGLEVTLRAADEAGRVTELLVWGSGGAADPTTSTYPYLEARSYCGPGAALSASVGGNVSLTIHNGDGTPSEGPTLVIVGGLGIDEVVVTNGSEIERTFAEGDLPSLTVRAVRLSPAGYIVLNDARIGIADGDKELHIAIEPDQERYAPGEEVGITITTTGPGGTPRAADVVVQALDSKLHAIGAVRDINPSALMAPVSSGFLTAYSSHRLPSPASDCGFGAATGGDDVRENFADLATFQLVTTGDDGRGSARFVVPDDLTSWVVSTTAVGDELEAGTASIEIPVGLPFFVQATIASQYLAGEEPVIRVAAYGDGLAADDRVRFTIDAPSLGLEETHEGAAFEAVRLPLPALSLGAHEITIGAERLGPGTALSDAVLRVVRVVPTRLRALETAYETVTDTVHPGGGDGLTTYVITDAGRGALFAVLQELAWASSARFDSSLAAELAREMLIDDFSVEESELPASGFGGTEGHPVEGLALLPYASADLYLTARTALVAPEKVLLDHLRPALRTEADTTTSRERRIVALAGLAGLGQEVIAELRTIELDGLSIRERIWLGLGLLAAGDEEAARSIQRAILVEHGQRLGPWVRLDAGTPTPETLEATASMLLLSAQLRDPIAMNIARYLRENSSSEYLPALEQLGFARAAHAWLPREAARFAWTVNGVRHEERLERGGAISLVLAADQRRTLSLEPLEGELQLATSWMGEPAYDELPSDPAVAIERAVSPADHAPTDELVQVVLNVRFSTQAVAGCYQVTDLVPSGLSPVVAPTSGWSAHSDLDVIGPYEVEGQRVSWCIGPERANVALGYSARVISSGTYRWEPAVIQAVAAPSVGAATPTITYRIDD